MSEREDLDQKTLQQAKAIAEDFRLVAFFISEKEGWSASLRHALETVMFHIELFLEVQERKGKQVISDS